MDSLTAGLIIIIVCLVSIAITAVGEVRKLKKDLVVAKQLRISDLWLVREKIKLASTKEFKKIIEYIFRQSGYQTTFIDSDTEDSKDIILKKNGEIIFVECKHWKEFVNQDDDTISEVNRPIAQKLKGAMDYGLNGTEPVKKGMIVSTTSYTKECKEYCDAMNIELFYFNDIMKMVKEVGSTNLYKMLGITTRYEF